MSAGDGASFNFADYGQDGSPLNPCGDPPGGRGGTHDAADRRGRRAAQPGHPHDRRPDGPRRRDPAGRSRHRRRACRATRTSASADPNTRRIVAHGLRNPFRITVRPGTNEIWAGDVGWNTWEEINRVQTPTAGMHELRLAVLRGRRPPGRLRRLNLNLCENLYTRAASAVATPYYTYNHSAKVVAGETCPTGGSSISGLAFYTGGSFPARLRRRAVLLRLHAATASG